MKGGGYYSQRTRGAKDVIDNAVSMLEDAVAALPAVQQNAASRSLITVLQTVEPPNRPSIEPYLP